jgi:hypothetical protein
MDVVPIAEVVGSLAEAGSFTIAARRRRVEDFGRLLGENTEKSGEALLDLMEKEDLFAEIVERGLDSAMRTSSAEKRSLLATVVASALDGAGFARPNESLLVIRTIDVLQPTDLQLLVRLAMPIPNSTSLGRTPMEGYFTVGDILDSWPEWDNALDPTLAVLTREGLIQSVQGTDGSPAYAPSPHGRRVLSFLAAEYWGRLDLDAAALTVRLEGPWRQFNPESADPKRLSIVVRNLGPGTAQSIEPRASVRGQRIGMDARSYAGFDLGPLEEHAIEVTTLLLRPISETVKVHLGWIDRRSDTQHHRVDLPV